MPIIINKTQYERRDTKIDITRTYNKRFKLTRKGFETLIIKTRLVA